MLGGVGGIPWERSGPHQGLLTLSQPLLFWVRGGARSPLLSERTGDYLPLGFKPSFWPFPKLLTDLPPPGSPGMVFWLPVTSSKGWLSSLGGPQKDGTE